MGKFVCPPDHKHDETTTCYFTHSCRCEPCRANHSVRRRVTPERRAELNELDQRRRERRSMVGRLVRAGFPDNTIMEVMGLTANMVAKDRQSQGLEANLREHSCDRECVRCGVEAYASERFPWCRDCREADPWAYIDWLDQRGMLPSAGEVE